MLHTVTKAIEWSKEYDDKSKIKKIFLNSRYKKKFLKMNDEITMNYTDLVLSIFLTHYFPNDISTSDIIENEKIT